MTKYTLALFFLLCTMNAGAQKTFTEAIQQVKESMGQIVLHQDKTITDLVNGISNALTGSSSKATAGRGYHQVGDSIVADSLLTGQKVKRTGYRIQVYFGDNSRQGKSEARAAGTRFKNYFPETPVYVSFVSPQWLCRVGDFQTHEEATEFLHHMREMGVFTEALIVKSKINVRL